jgi:hypothetical protein
MSNFNFNANEEAPDAGRMLASAGWHSFVCTKLEHKPTEGGDGEKITGNFEIVEGIYKGVNVFHNFNMRNASEKAEKIGRGQFSALCHATRQLVIQQLTQLYSVPFRGKLKITTDPSGQYEPKNEFTAFKDYSDPAAVDVGGVAAPTAGPKVVAPPTAPPAQAAPIGQPWAAGGQVQASAQPPVQQQPAGMAPQPWTQPAQAPVQQQAPVAQPQPTPEQIAAWQAQQAAQAQAAAAAAYAAQQAQMQAAQPPQGQPAWAAAPAVDPNAVAASQAAPGQNQTVAQPQGPAVAQQTPPWMVQPTA